MTKKLVIVLTAALLVLQIGCAKRSLVRYDESGKVITEEELKEHKGRGNFLLYTLGGGALSFGVSLFLGSLVQRASDNGNAAFVSITVGGTIVGISFFAWQGLKRDRLQAIEKIKEQRKNETLIRLRREQQKQEQIKKTTEKIKEEREKLEEEKKKLIEELEKRKKQKP